MIKIAEARKQLGIDSKKEFLELIYKYTGKTYSLNTSRISDKIWKEFLRKYEFSKEEFNRKVYKKNEVLIEEKEFLSSLGIGSSEEIQKEEKSKQFKEEIERQKVKKGKKDRNVKSVDVEMEKFRKKKFKGETKIEKKERKGYKKKSDKIKKSKTQRRQEVFIQKSKGFEELEKKGKEQLSKQKERFVKKGFKEAKVSDTLKKKEEVTLPDVITVKEFSEKIGVPVNEIIKKLIENKIIAGITTSIDYDTAVLIAEEFGVKVKKEGKSLNIEDFIEGNLQKILEEDKNAEILEERPPIVTIMGHVDHGKTKLLDYIRRTNIVEKEVGGITQSIGASQIEFNGKKVTFIDTPGHELFTELRARGVKITDIAIIVVAADEGVKQQTIEAINHAKDAKVPIIVAITKIDKPNANVEKVKGELAELGLVPSDWGGDIEVIPVSSITGEGINDLLETILLQAEILELRYNPNRSGVGVVLEAKKDVKKGVVVSIILMTGILKLGDPVFVFDTFGRVRRLISWRGEDLTEIRGGDPAQILGIQNIPQPGRILEVVSSEREAKHKVEKLKEALIRYKKKSVMSDILEKLQKGDKVTLKLIFKADTFGSLEVLKGVVDKIELPGNVDIDIIHADIGTISDNDILLADASKGVVIGFNVPLSKSVRKKAESLKVDVKIFDIIYEVIDYLKNLVMGLVKPEEKKVQIGRLEVLGIFYKKRNEMIIGGKVIEGKVINGSYFKLVKKDKKTGDEIQVGEGKIISLKRETENVDEVRQGYECGLKVKVDKKIQLGDILDFYVVE